MLGAQLMIILDATVVNIALPQVYGFVRAAASGWGDHLVLGSFGAAVALLAAFLAVEARARQPITPLRAFRPRPATGPGCSARWCCWVSAWGWCSCR